MSDHTAIGTTISLPEPPTGWFEYGYAVLMDGTLALLRADHDIWAALRHWKVGGARGFLPKLWDGHARLSIFDGRAESDAIEVQLGFSPIVSRLADGRWLLAASRSARGEANGRLYATDGTASGTIALGDGIDHLCCAPDGTIWAGYCDEGIGSGPISSGDIVRFDPDGRALWSFNSDDRHDLCIFDCYAMTLNANTLRSCFYSDFPIVRVEDSVISSWSNAVRGARALAVDRDHILLAGGYDEEAERLILLRLDSGQACQLSELRFPPLRAAAHVQGLADTLHIIGQGAWTRMGVADARDVIVDGTSATRSSANPTTQPTR